LRIACDAESEEGESILAPVSGSRSVRQARSTAAAVVLLLLLLPASDLLPLTRWNWHLWTRLREAGRETPDSGVDRFNQQLAMYMPMHGAIGFVSTDPPQSPDVSRVYGFLQYSLAPRLLVRSSDFPLVILYSPGSADPALLHDPQFTLVATPGNGLFVLRRIGR
jgi:hypothetical protein